MTRWSAPGRTRVRRVMAVLAFGLLVTAAACSGDEGDDDTTPPPTQTIPSSTGDECADPVGDLTLGSSSEPRAEPAGIDIVEASAVLSDDQLDVRFTTAGPINLVPAPSFVIAQGIPFQPLSFEVRVVRDEQTGNWGVTIITWPQEEQQRAVLTQPVVDNNTISFSLPASELPPLANYLSFGATSDVPDVGVVIDDCSSLNQPPTTG
jgi:hypothetical protein